MTQCPTAGELNKLYRQPSKRCEAFIKGYEQCRLKAYLPTADDVPTIGWGSTGPDIKLGRVWTQEQADARFASDLAEFAAGVRKAIGDAPTKQCEFDALVSIAYNVGIAAISRSTLMRLHVDGDHKRAADQFLRWVYQKGKVLNGLVKRRTAERLMYLGETA